MSKKQLVEQALKDPQQALIELDRADCADSLMEFVKLAWPQLEPSNKFVPGRAIEVVAEHLEAVTRGEITRLLINIPPGFSKSMLTNVFWPAWEWGPKGLPSHRFISASYDKGLSVRDLVRCRDLIKSKWFQDRWPLAIKDDEDGKEHYANTSTGWRVARSVGSGLTGWRGDRIVVDDPHSVKTAESDAERFSALRWFTETLPTRFNDQDKSALVVIMQRLHENDISGHILEHLRDKYTCLIMPMEYEQERHCRTNVTLRSTGMPFEDWRSKDGELLWPERFGEKAVKELKDTLSSHGGSYAVAGQLQQLPVPREGGMFSLAYAQYADKAPEEGKTVRGWDLAASTTKKSPYTVGTKLRKVGRTIYICDVVRDRVGPHALEQLLLNTAKADGFSCHQSIPQDPGQAGKHQKSSLAGLLEGFQVWFSPETGEKKDRAIPLAAQWEAGNVVIVRGPWNDALLAEMKLFPNSTFLDQVDSMSRAYAHLLSMFEDNDVGTTPGIIAEY